MNILDSYLKSIRQYNRVNSKEEQDLFTIITNEKDPKLVIDAKHKIISANLRLVVSRVFLLAKKHSNNNDRIMDLISEGNIALIRSVNRYKLNHNSGATFGTFATKAIDRRLINFIMIDKFIKIPSYYYSYKKKIEFLKNKYGNKLTDKIILEELKITKEIFKILKDDTIYYTSYLEDLFKDENWQDIIGKNNFYLDDKNGIYEYLKKHLDKLSELEKKVLIARHFSSRTTFKNIATDFNITSEKVRQTYFIALRKMRASIIKDWDNKKHDVSTTKKYIKHHLNKDTQSYEEKEKIRKLQYKKVFDNLLNQV